MSSTTRILIVDDEPANRRLLSAILTPTFGTTVHAADGQEALAILAREPIDLVVLDVMMPGPDGVAVCTTIRSDPATAFVPIILVTALADAASRARGKAAGADDFLTKPIHEDELLARATNLLRMRRYHAQVEAQREDAAREAAFQQMVAADHDVVEHAHVAE